MYYNIYNKEVCDWCVNNVITDTLRMFDERQCMLLRVEQYAHEHEKVLVAIIPQHITCCDANGLDAVRGIPRDQIFTDGMYFEMEPGVWRLVVYNIEMWNAYAKFLTGRGTRLEYYKQAYSDFVRYYGNFILSDMLRFMPEVKECNTDMLLCFLQVYLHMVGNHFEIIHTNEPTDVITKDLFQGAGMYFYIPTVGWKKYVNNHTDLKKLLGYKVD